jgi:hypothetical protein
MHAEKVVASRRDATPEERWGALSYPRNPVGRGFFAALEIDRLEGELLPNLDDPDDPVEPTRLLAEDGLDWIDRPVAASYGPIHVTTFPRCMFHLARPDWRPPQRRIHELSTGALLASDLDERELTSPPDPRVFNSAPAGLAVCRLQGNERATLWNLHPRHEMLEVDLPGTRPVLVLEPPRTRPYELPGELASVLFEPDEDRVTLTWAASMQVAAVFPEPLCLEMPNGVRWE